MILVLDTKLCLMSAEQFWNCVAFYSDTYLDTLTGHLPVVPTPTSSHTTDNRSLCAAQATATYNSLSLPGALIPHADAMAAIGITVETSLDTNIEACGSDVSCLQQEASAASHSPTIMGHIVAKLAYDYSIDDGWNQLGKDDGCVVNCRAYRDITGFEPVNLPYASARNPNSVRDRWQPLLEDDGKGFYFYQEHVTAQIGQNAKFRNIPETDRHTRVAAHPTYSRSRRREARDVVRLMRTLDDTKKIQIEIFDNKLIVANALIGAFVGKTIDDGFVDTALPPAPGLILSYERLMHYVVGLVSMEYDAVIIAWKEKINYDQIRPTSVIKSAGLLPIRTWAPGGTQIFPAENFEAYIRVMPHSEYVSGSACLFQGQEDYIKAYLTHIGLSTTSFPVVFEEVAAGASIVEPGVVPASPVTLSYPDIETMAAVGSQSRLDGGMHFDQSVPAAKALCQGIGDIAAAKTFDLIH